MATEQKIYSWLGTKIQVPLPVELAENFNKFQKAFFDAQRKFMEENGRQWSHVEPLMIHSSREENEDWNKIGDLINYLVDLNGGSINIGLIDIKEDYLIPVE